IIISFDPELEFACSLYQRKAHEILYMIPGSILHFGSVWREKIQKHLWRMVMPEVTLQQPALMQQTTRRFAR
ncbi:hypothetical protein KI387_014982, partial [Taxus chinensis]